jgi:Txe/YoeB family toxin of Txe-Axe toxin-antitoxin module
MIDFDDEDDDDFDDYSFHQFKENYTNFSSNKLCEIIVCNRYLGFYKEEALCSMQELSTRRMNGDDFDFESKIDLMLNELPKLNISSIPDFNSIMNQVMGKSK